MKQLLLLLTLLAAPPARAQIFADFKTKQGTVDFGNFTIQLDHTYAPYAVANFINLAEGRVSWPDPANGKTKTGPFYNGLEFYAASPNFLVAAGSPDDSGNGGPGYVFRDDFRNSVPAQLGFIPEQWAIFMENNGPNTNGSRFFLNLSATVNPTLRPGRYMRFGQVIAPTNPPGGNGRGIVQNISFAAPGFITINTVTIRYVGTDATNFRTAMQNPNHPYLSTHPTSTPAKLSFRHTGSAIFLDWDTVSGSIAQLWSSFNLMQWIGPFPVMNVPGDTDFGLDLTPTIQFSPEAYFRGVVTTYADWPSTGRPLANRAIQTNFFDPARGAAFTTIYQFDHTGAAGAYSSPFGSGNFTVTGEEVLGPYSSRLQLTRTTGPGATYRFTLHYDLTWSSPIPSVAVPAEANPSRLAGENLANPGTPLTGGQWSYVP